MNDIKILLLQRFRYVTDHLINGHCVNLHGVLSSNGPPSQRFAYMSRYRDARVDDGLSSLSLLGIRPVVRLMMLMTIASVEAG